MNTYIAGLNSSRRRWIYIYIYIDPDPDPFFTVFGNENVCLDTNIHAAGELFSCFIFFFDDE